MSDPDPAFLEQVESDLSEAMQRSSAIEWALEVAIADAADARGFHAWRCVRHNSDGPLAPGMIRNDIPFEGDSICRGYIFGSAPREAPMVLICREVTRASYRIDLLVRLVGPRTDGGRHVESVLAVECDGHDYHERTKQQAAYDRSRDRELLIKLGLVTVRFTGSEIYSDANRCARECIDSLLAVRPLTPQRAK